MDALTKLKVWCAENDILLMLGEYDTCYDWESDTIMVEDYPTTDEVVHSILHECGHYLIQSDDDYVVKYRDKVRPRCEQEYRRGFLREEHNAWKEGEKLAHLLGIKIDSDAFWALAETCLSHYARMVEK